MSRSRTMLLLTASLLLTTGLPAQSLQDRIAARRREAEARARQEVQAKQERQQVDDRNRYDPKRDTDLWKIREFHVPMQSVMGIPVAGGDEARFYAHVRTQYLPQGTSVGTRVYFYELVDRQIRLAGRGAIAKLRERRGDMVVEAKIEGFRHAKLIYPRRNSPQWAASSGAPVLQLVGRKKPENESWFMATTLRGPDTQGWSLKEVEGFALGMPWKGMSEDALIALLGQPDQRLEAGGQARLVYGEGEDAKRFTVIEGKVVDMLHGTGY